MSAHFVGNWNRAEGAPFWSFSGNVGSRMVAEARLAPATRAATYGHPPWYWATSPSGVGGRVGGSGILNTLTPQGGTRP